jgi:hypothetical protein
MLCEICFVLLNWHLPHYVCNAQYGFFCSTLISYFPGMVLRYCRSDFEMVPVAPVVTGITFAFTFHMHWISIMRSLYTKIIIIIISENIFLPA